MPEVIFNKPDVTTTINDTNVSQWQVFWIENLDFQAVHKTNGSTKDFTLDPADAVNGRIDLFVEQDNDVILLPGTPSENPAEPEVDPITQLKIRFVIIEAGATEPAGAVKIKVYDENIGAPDEYITTIKSGVNVNIDAVGNPNTGVKHMSFTDVANRVQIEFTHPETRSIAGLSYVQFFIKKVSRGLSGMFLHFSRAGVQQGNGVIIRDGNYGFNRDALGSYERILIPIEDFTGISDFDSIIINFVKSITTETSTFYLDTVTVNGDEGGATLDEGNTFLALTDTPDSYEGQNEKMPVVQDGRLIFKDPVTGASKIIVFGNEFNLVKHPDNNDPLQVQTLEINDIITSGYRDINTYWPLAIYQGGAIDQDASWNAVNPIQEIPVN